MAIATINPATGRTEKQFDALDASGIEQRLEIAESASAAMKGSSFDQRRVWLTAAAERLHASKDALAAMMTTEMGKPLTAAKAEVEKCAWVCDYYADKGPQFLADRPIETAAQTSFARYLPLGPVLAVMPWNFPLWQVFRFAAPAVMAGNVGLLKHASNVPQSALAIEEVFKEAGLPNGGFQTLLISGDQVESVLKDNRIKAATVTGSEGAGRAVAQVAGAHLKKVVLELGGSDPFIVMPSANLEEAADKAARGRLLNNGQSCIAAKRFIVHDDVYDTFRGELIQRFEAQTVGDPMDDDTDIGPMATQAIRDELAEQVDESLAAGARRVMGAKVLDRDGWYYEPGILEDVPSQSPAAREELFGPVAMLFKVGSFNEAIDVANASRFGLGSAVFTQEEHEIERAFDELEAGGTFINTITASDPRLPFGGIKASGIGRELAADGIREFTNLKTCCIGSST